VSELRGHFPNADGSDSIRLDGCCNSSIEPVSMKVVSLFVIDFQRSVPGLDSLPCVVREIACCPCDGVRTSSRYSTYFRKIASKFENRAFFLFVWSTKMEVSKAKRTRAPLLLLYLHTYGPLRVWRASQSGTSATNSRSNTTETTMSIAF